ncbi:MAG: ferrochelatase [Firmicutes bacterium]|nr:ferrochelatase [Bacillota bacterium]
MTRAVLLMAYGSPLGPEDVERYYTHIRHGRPPSEAELQELAGRYAAIGGVSPLAQITERQAAALEAELRRGNTSSPLKVYLGLKHSPPFIGDAVRQMAEDRVEEAVALVLAPHYSAMSVGTYLDEAEGAIEALGRPLVLRPVKSWAQHPGLIALLAERVTEAFGRFSAKEREHLPVIFTAHSLPTRIVAEGDPYPQELQKTGDLVAQRLELAEYTFAWQSAGRTREPWLKPDILEKLTMMAENGYRQALVCPAGFVADHLEVLYDLDIQAQRHARSLGLHMERTRSFNDDPAFIAVLADIVRSAWGEATS